MEIKFRNKNETKQVQMDVLSGRYHTQNVEFFNLFIHGRSISICLYCW